jgi:hypothetical protein
MLGYSSLSEQPFSSQPSAPAQTLQPGLYTNAQTFFAPTVVPIAPVADRGDGWIPQIKRKRKFKEEADERAQLRKLIEAAVDPVDADEAEVVTVEDKVTVVTKTGPTATIPVPPQFDAQAVAKMVVSVLEEREIEAKRVRYAKAKRRAQQIIAAWAAENERRRIKRRREEEIMLLM